MFRLCLSLSYLLSYVFFSFPQCKGVSLPVFSFFPPEEIVAYVAVDSMCLWEKVNPGASYVNIFNQNYMNFFNEKNCKALAR